MTDAQLQKLIESIRCTAPDCDADSDVRLGRHKQEIVVRCSSCERILIRPFKK
jgi:hypothetical protein